MSITLAPEDLPKVPYASNNVRFKKIRRKRFHADPCIRSRIKVQGAGTSNAIFRNSFGHLEPPGYQKNHTQFHFHL